MNDKAVVDRTVRCHDGGLRADRESAGGLDLYAIAILNFDYTRSGKNTAAKLENRPRHSVEIFERMKLRLPGKSQHGIGFKSCGRDCIHALNFAQAGAMQRPKFARQFFDCPAWRNK